ncbi:MAG: polyprenyl synthetase family protein, partial [Oscillospiraceae bacterium]|nr:polyprenyl synthetase family protein [Oscillospiraceae bacterium]
CGKDWEKYADLACGVEMIHCYTLIHDDLPCMDNDDLRRGKPSCHKAFAEDTALLAGDALLGCGIETVANSQDFSVADRLKAVQLMCAAMGPKGMIYGQELDLRFETETADKEQLALIHRNKTGQLISLCGKLGSLEAQLTDGQKKAIEVFFANTGLVFQIVDDILDVESSEEELGKPIGSDAENGKSTFITLYGLEESKRRVEQLTKEANELLYSEFGEKAEHIIDYTSKLAQRRK